MSSGYEAFPPSTVSRPLTHAYLLEKWGWRSFAFAPKIYALMILAETIFVISFILTFNAAYPLFVQGITSLFIMILAVQIPTAIVSTAFWYIFKRKNFSKGTHLKDVLRIRKAAKAEINALHRAKNLPQSSMFPNDSHSSPLTKENYSRLWGKFAHIADPKYYFIHGTIGLIALCFIPFLWVSIPLGLLIIGVGIAIFRRWRNFIDESLGKHTSIKEAVNLRNQLSKKFGIRVQVPYIYS